VRVNPDVIIVHAKQYIKFFTLNTGLSIADFRFWIADLKAKSLSISDCGFWISDLKARLSRRTAQGTRSKYKESGLNEVTIN
jgi:hypothetical protein